MGRIAGRFTRVETRRRTRTLVEAMRAELPRKNCWTLAEHAGDTSPGGMQHLLSRASWDTDGVRDDLRDFVVENLGGTGTVLIVDETGDLKKGTRSVGVQRQYTGTAGRVENSQVAVYLAYSTEAGHTFIDRELYLPACWTCAPGRCREAGVPAGVGFATKPDLALRMIVRVLGAGVRAGWVAGDEVYGQSPALRGELEQRGVGHVLAVAARHRVDTGTGGVRVDELVARLPGRAWQRCSAGRGAKGHRFHDWALVAVEPGEAGCRWLPARRSRRTGEYAFYRCRSPCPVPLRVLVGVAGRRRAVEECFQTAKGLCGLDQHQVRTWTSWRRWTVLAMCAHALLVAVAVAVRPAVTGEGAVPYSAAEVRRLVGSRVDSHVQRWSDWRRRHQARARASHYRRQSAYEP
ncbi:IS701 family transposase [Sinosporangium siamense]|nr:IS701 family transposase [Sinosporangium siamense]